MQKPSKQLWQIVPRPIQTKVARGWLNREGTIAYLGSLYEATWHPPAGEIQSAAARGPPAFLRRRTWTWRGCMPWRPNV